MKICLAQTHPTKGNIHKNIEDHQKLIACAAAEGAEIIIFPELSLTGYEPSLATSLATTPDDRRLDIFQTLTDVHGITIGVGLPIRASNGVCISMIVFQAGRPRRTYSKRYLHADEEPFFVCGSNFPVLPVNEINVGLAICYELSIPEHAAAAAGAGAAIYLASVAKSQSGVEQAGQRLADIAHAYQMVALMVNCVGPSDDFVSAGRSAVWDSDGRLLVQLEARTPGLLLFDTQTGDYQSLPQPG